MVPGAGRVQDERRTWRQILRGGGGLVLLAWRRVDFPIEALVAEAGDSADNPDRGGYRHRPRVVGRGAA
jgi:hypothetical protein